MRYCLFTSPDRTRLSVPPSVSFIPVLQVQMTGEYSTGRQALSLLALLVM
jgi:hypothetical protein